MLNEIAAFCRRENLLEKGDRVVCAVSGGADSVALLFALYLLKDRLELKLSAAHFNHCLRGQESDRDARFVKDLCEGYGIPLFMEKGQVTPGPKGLEAAAREARYRFLESLDGKIATAHTADDNAETVLMHLVRGTGLKGLGGICPKRGKLIRPMLTVTRTQVLAFLESYHLQWVEDSSNAEDDFLRNRIRHGVMPLLRWENPQIAENLTETALRLRQDEAVLEALSPDTEEVARLRKMDASCRSRALGKLLRRMGVPEPEAAHIALAERLVLSQNPSARADFPGGITLTREYGRLVKYQTPQSWGPVPLAPDGVTEIPALGIQIHCQPAQTPCFRYDAFTVQPHGPMVVRPRISGDEIRLHGGTKSLKKLFADRKIPVAQRQLVPVIADDLGVLGVGGIGANLARVTGQGITITIVPIKR